MKASVIVLASVAGAAPVQLAARQAAGIGNAAGSIINGAVDGINSVATAKGLNDPALDTLTRVTHAAQDTVKSFTSGLRKRQFGKYPQGIDYLINGPVDGTEAVTDEQGDVADGVIADTKEIVGDIGLPTRRQVKGYTESVDDFINGPVLGAEAFTQDQGDILDGVAGDGREILGDVGV